VAASMPAATAVDAVALSPVVKTGINRELPAMGSPRARCKVDDGGS